jgi:hypothetical protein
MVFTPGLERNVVRANRSFCGSGKAPAANYEYWVKLLFMSPAGIARFSGFPVAALVKSVIAATARPATGTQAPALVEQHQWSVDCRR